MQKSKSKTIDWGKAEDIEESIKEILETLNFDHVDTKRLHCFRSHGSKARAYARTWTFPKIFQIALKIKPVYAIEVISKYFDKLDEDNKKKVLIHELLHIPKNFSGALLPHRSRGRSIGKQTNELFKEYKKLTK
ncbi:MAG: putative metallopeptidase [bacterium]|nr:putative metallopeptidase [bacterium]